VVAVWAGAGELRADSEATLVWPEYAARLKVVEEACAGGLGGEESALLHASLAQQMGELETALHLRALDKGFAADVVLRLPWLLGMLAAELGGEKIGVQTWGAKRAGGVPPRWRQPLNVTWDPHLPPD
jgi:hypothetical protein